MLIHTMLQSAMFSIMVMENINRVNFTSLPHCVFASDCDWSEWVLRWNLKSFFLLELHLQYALMNKLRIFLSNSHLGRYSKKSHSSSKTQEQIAHVNRYHFRCDFFVQLAPFRRTQRRDDLFIETIIGFSPRFSF